MIVLETSRVNPDNELVLIDGVKHKICTKCFEPRLLDKFGKDKRGFIGLAGRCRICDKVYRDANKERGKKYNDKYREENKEKIYVVNRKYQENNKEEIRRKEKIWRDNNKGRIAARDRKYRSENKEVLQAKKLIYKKNRYDNDPWFKLNRDVAMRFRYNLKKAVDKNRILYNLGYSIEDLKQHLIGTLPDGYQWTDYISGIIQIDHVKPLAAFHYTSTEEHSFKECWAIGNLQLLLAYDNLMKGIKYDADSK